jgi:hypothetical protein
MLRNAFEATLNDAEFRAEAAKRKLDLDFTSGSDIRDTIDRIYRTPPAVVARVKEILGDQLPE